MEKKNIRKYYLRYVLYYFGYVLVTGGMIQSFMLESGISSVQVSVYTAIIQFVQAAALLLLGPVLEKQKNIIRLNAEAGYGLLPVFVAMLVICFVPGMSADWKYTLIVISSVLAYFSLGVIGILEYKLPYRIIRMEHYGTVVSMAGMTIGMTSLFCSSLVSFFISRFDYFKVMPVFLVIGMLLAVAAEKVGSSYEDLTAAESADAEEEESGKEDGTEAVQKSSPVRDFVSIFAYEPFRKLFVPNLLRGVASGAFALLTTVGYYYGIVNASAAAVMTMVSNFVIMGGCILYARLSDKGIDGKLVLGSSVMLCLLMPMMLVGRNTTVFIALYGAATLFRNFIDYGCPVICAQIVDYEHVGQFSSWRIALYMLGAAIAGLITVPMLELLGGTVTMLINGVIFVVTGLGYYRISAMNKRKSSG